MTTTRLTIEEATALVVETLLRCRTSQDNAQSVASALVGAELAGQAGHGLRRVPAYSAQALAGKVDGMATPEATQTRPGALAVDAAHGFAYPALDLAVEWLPAAARGQGIVIAGISRSHHSGVTGLVVERLAEAGVAGLMVANSPAAMAPWGGKRPLFGTNPIAFAAPLAGADPIIVDVSLSKVARGKIMAAEQKGTSIPEGWALDRSGNPTTDPTEALAGTMVPMGEAKGTALAIMVEMLCAGLTGANYAYDATSFFDAKGSPPGTGQTVIAIDPEAFGPGATARFAQMARLIEETEGARLPGRRRQALKREMVRDGIAVDSDLLERIRSIGR
ncbi:Ldh family oxidoreductase [Chelativorans xinjiangense]|uniref:Ldh family oxidoreductase n=1 Tax=Chelativorans xinjiangense TaxID=2681485 RepID=UPI00135AAB45|nr:Ldh family oxidoreductase [Chelativorans xinjiangense]